MADTQALPLPPPRARSADWVWRLYEAAPFAPLATGGLLALAYLALSAAVRLAFGRDYGGGDATPLGDPFLWLDVLNAVLFAYIPTAHVLLRRGARRDLADLRPTLAGDAERFRSLADRVLGLEPRWLVLAGVLGGLFFGSMPVLDPLFWAGLGRPPLTDPLLLFLMARGAVMGCLVGHAVASEATLTARYAELGAEHVQVDLLDLDALAPFGRRGVRTALAWIGCVSLVSLFWLGPAAGSTNGYVMSAALLLVAFAFGATLLGVHRRIRDTKRARLVELAAEIRREQEDVMRARDEGRSVDARLADLVAYRTLIEHVREWPVGAPALVRLGLVALLGLGSWLGGALVERLLERALG